MNNIIEMFHKAKKKKISFDINEVNLEMVDELAKIFDIKRSKMLDVLIVSGLWGHVNLSIREWEDMKKRKTSEEYRRIENKKRIEKLIRDVKKFKKKWAIVDIPK